ncbi:Ribosome-binding protein 1 [Orchesella cincta]|uniref:Ribosome-binding protein 1 n=1 Tax=Orchesella cincta TaxID=48709 RepID=A0A1D2MLF4_ORCCI|nr:Ribosome-binding protein 1 [Orchesella cincta]
MERGTPGSGKSCKGGGTVKPYHHYNYSLVLVSFVFVRKRGNQVPQRSPVRNEAPVAGFLNPINREQLERYLGIPDPVVSNSNPMSGPDVNNDIISQTMGLFAQQNQQWLTFMKEVVTRQHEFCTAQMHFQQQQLNIIMAQQQQKPQRCRVSGPFVPNTVAVGGRGPGGQSSVNQGVAGTCSVNHGAIGTSSVNQGTYSVNHGAIGPASVNQGVAGTSSVNQGAAGTSSGNQGAAGTSSVNQGAAGTSSVNQGAAGTSSVNQGAAAEASQPNGTQKQRGITDGNHRQNEPVAARSIANAKAAMINQMILMKRRRMAQLALAGIPKRRTPYQASRQKVPVPRREVEVVETVQSRIPDIPVIPPTVAVKQEPIDLSSSSDEVEDSTDEDDDMDYPLFIKKVKQV